MLRKTLTILSLIDVSLAALFGCFSTLVLVRYDLVWIAVQVALAGVALSLILAMTARIFALIEGLALYGIVIVLNAILMDGHAVNHVAICAWFVIALGVTILSAVLRPRVGFRKRKKLGLCMQCGYDLRGSGERCPECNTQFEKT